jgi:energy-coupling factor transporter ATP-binding protein EcfA2
MEGSLETVSPARVFARPTADHVWLGPAQEAALNHLVRESKYRILLGPCSSGKSTLLNHLGHALKDEVVLPISGPQQHGRNVLTRLLLGADLAPWDLSDTDQRNLLSVVIQQRLSQGRRVIVVIDDPIGFSPDAWDEIERLRRVEDGNKRSVELVLGITSSNISHLPESAFKEFLRAADRESIHCLPTPDLKDTAAYLEWRLAPYGLADAFKPTAVRLVALSAGGRYAAINTLAQMVLLVLRREGARQADAPFVQRAAAELAALHRESSKSHRPDAGENATNPYAPPAHLLVTRNGSLLDRIKLGARVLVGRSEHNDLCLASPYLSRHHVAIVGTPEGYYVVDLNSVNGIQVNGNAVSRAVLYDQDILSIGPYRLKVQFQEALVDGAAAHSESLAETAVMPGMDLRGPPLSVIR